MSDVVGGAVTDAAKGREGKENRSKDNVVVEEIVIVIKIC